VEGAAAGVEYIVFYIKLIPNDLQKRPGAQSSVLNERIKISKQPRLDIFYGMK